MDQRILPHNKLSISLDETSTGGRSLTIGVVGLGSMGKRRCRCLLALGVARVVGIDPRADRREEATAASGVATYADLDAAMAGEALGALCISVPPNLHAHFLRQALSLGLPAFVEAGVLAGGLKELAEEAARERLELVPSNTMVFHPAVRRISEVLAERRLGRISNITHECGNYLPSWHPWEPVEDMYSSHRETGGAREMVAFELRWLTHLLGVPRRALGMRARTVALPGTDIDDTYALLLDWAPAIGALVVDVVARPTVRRLAIIGEMGQLRWDWTENAVHVYDAAAERWEVLTYDQPVSHPGYDIRIGEQMYVDECAAFLDHLDGVRPFPHDMSLDLQVLDLLYQAEGEATVAGSVA